MTSNDALIVSLSDSEISNYWRLCDELTVRQTAFLIVGVDPDSQVGVKSRDRKNDERPSGYGAALQAITAKLRDRLIEGEHFQEIDTDINGNPVGEIDGSTDIDRSTVNAAAVARWLFYKGYRSGFFFPDGVGEPDYMNVNDARYAPKLAATVRAWEAVTDPKGKSPKQALIKWLREHAAEFGQSDDDGVPINQAMEECSAVANWQPKGGAAKTPGG